MSARKRILFVDDDPLLLRVYEMMMADETDRWEVSTLNDASEALKLVTQSAFDVVVSDMRMPGMSGTELMRELQVRHPRTSRVILSGLRDQREIAESLQATHQFVPKPFHPIELKTALGQIARLNTFLLDDRLQTLVGRLEVLPSFPSLYLEVVEELSKEEPSVASVADIVSKDPALVAKILQVVNSAALGLIHRVSSPFEAVQFLGLSTIRSITLTVHVFSNCGKVRHESFSPDRLCDHSIRTGLLARKIMQLEGGDSAAAEDAYTSGMLHDIGKLMLADNLPDQFQEALELTQVRRIPLHEAEMQVFGATHAGCGAYVLGLWGLPSSIVEAVALHHMPAEDHAGSFTPTTAVHVASALEQKLFPGLACGEAAGIDEAHIASLKKIDRLKIWEAKARQVLHAAD